MEIRSGVVYFLTTSLFTHAQNPLPIMVISAWLCSLYIIVFNVGMQFLYRYNIVCMKTKWSNLQFFGIYSLAVFYSLFLSVSYYFVFDQMSDEYTELLQSNLMYGNDTPGYSVSDMVRNMSYLQKQLFLCKL